MPFENQSTRPCLHCDCNLLVTMGKKKKKGKKNLIKDSSSSLRMRKSSACVCCAKGECSKPNSAVCPSVRVECVLMTTTQLFLRTRLHCSTATRHRLQSGFLSLHHGSVFGTVSALSSRLPAAGARLTSVKEPHLTHENQTALSGQTLQS